MFKKILLSALILGPIFTSLQALDFAGDQECSLKSDWKKRREEKRFEEALPQQGGNYYVNLVVREQQIESQNGIAFERQVIGEGFKFSSNSHVLKAPKSGPYLISFTLVKSNDPINELDFAIAINNKVQKESITAGHSGQVIVQLKEDDVIELKNVSKEAAFLKSATLVITKL